MTYDEAVANVSEALAPPPTSAKRALEADWRRQQREKLESIARSSQRHGRRLARAVERDDIEGAVEALTDLRSAGRTAESWVGKP